MATGIKEILRGLGQYRMLNRVTAANVALFLLIPIANLIVHGVGNMRFDAASLLALHSGWSVLPGRIWTLLTYMFTQTDILHLIVNILWLYGFGIVLTNLRGNSFFLLVFIASGLAGAAGYLLTATKGELLGCSAAALGVMTACGAAAPDMEVRLYGFWKMRLMWIAAIGVIIAMLGSAGNPAQAAAHLGGLTGGIITVLASKWRRPRKSEKVHIQQIQKNYSSGKLTAAMQSSTSDPERLDSLLDKIRISGYSSLSGSERSELARLSSKIKEQ